MSNTTSTALLSAARRANGDFRATERALARWCTEELRATASYLSVPRKFASEGLPTWREATREECLWLLCGWTNWQRLEDWSASYEAARRAAIAALPQALAELGAAL